MAALRDLLDKATAQPWRLEDGEIFGADDIVLFDVSHEIEQIVLGDPDAAAIVALVNAAPVLLAEIEGLRERLARQDAVIEAARLLATSTGRASGSQVRTYNEEFMRELRAALDARETSE